MRHKNTHLTTVLGPVGCSKTRRIILPQIIKAIETGQSFLLCDPKENAWEYLEIGRASCRERV